MFYSAGFRGTLNSLRAWSIHFPLTFWFYPYRNNFKDGVFEINLVELKLYDWNDIQEKTGYKTSQIYFLRSVYSVSAMLLQVWGRGVWDLGKAYPDAAELRELEALLHVCQKTGYPWATACERGTESQWV